MSVGFAKLVGTGFRDKDTLISSVSRHLAREYLSERRADCLHPSMIAHEPWCERAAYYQISGAPVDTAPRSLAMELVFERGHTSHSTWQTWLWEMGVLAGQWRCRNCRLLWEDLSPTVCPRCEVGDDLIVYAEVPVHDDAHLIAGHADGDVHRPGHPPQLIEIKTIGPGTARFEAPTLVEKYTYHHIDTDGVERSGVDWEGLWRGIHRPFPSHLRQGMVYCFCAGRKEIVYIYEPKFVTAYPKAFEIKFDPSYIQDALERCLVVKDALEQQRVPKRPMWTDPTCRTCTECPFRSTCYGNITYREPHRSDRSTTGSRKTITAKARSGAARSASV